jgi:hypothetical protein
MAVLWTQSPTKCDNHAVYESRKFIFILQNPPLVPVSSQMNPISIITRCLRYVFIYSFPLRLDIRRGSPLSFSFAFCKAAVSIAEPQFVHSHCNLKPEQFQCNRQLASAVWGNTDVTALQHVVRIPLWVRGSFRSGTLMYITHFDLFIVFISTVCFAFVIKYLAL